MTRALKDLRTLQARLTYVSDHVVEGKSAAAIARERQTTAPTVRKWLLRYEEDGLPGLLDRRSPGRPRKIPQSVRDEIVRLTLQTRPPADLAPGRRWTTRLLARFFPVSPSHVANIWRDNGIDALQHGQQVARNPFRPVPLKIDLRVPAWVKLSLELILMERDWSLNQYVLARLVDAHPDQLSAELEERREEFLADLAVRWSRILAQLPEEDPRSLLYERDLARRRRISGV